MAVSINRGSISWMCFSSRSYYFGVYVRAEDFWKLPHLSSCGFQGVRSWQLQCTSSLWRCGATARSRWQPWETAKRGRRVSTRLLSGMLFLLFGLLGCYHVTLNQTVSTFFPGVTQQPRVRISPRRQGHDCL